MDDKKKKLRAMATWTATLFATIFALVLSVLWLINYQVSKSATSALGEAFAVSWPILLVVLVLCVGVYAGYTFFINRKK